MLASSSQAKRGQPRVNLGSTCTVQPIQPGYRSTYQGVDALVAVARRGVPLLPPRRASDPAPAPAPARASAPARPIPRRGLRRGGQRHGRQMVLLRPQRGRGAAQRGQRRVRIRVVVQPVTAGAQGGGAHAASERARQRVHTRGERARRRRERVHTMQGRARQGRERVHTRVGGRGVGESECTRGREYESPASAELMLCVPKTERGDGKADPDACLGLEG